MWRPIALAGLIACLATPALAYPNCLMSGGPGLRIEFGVQVGGDYTEAEQAQFDKMRLRQAGINADTVERTHLGCFKVTRIVGGGWVTEYYDPATLDLVPID